MSLDVSAQFEQMTLTRANSLGLGSHNPSHLLRAQLRMTSLHALTIFFWFAWALDTVCGLNSDCGTLSVGVIVFRCKLSYLKRLASGTCVVRLNNPTTVTSLLIAGTSRFSIETAHHHPACYDTDSRCKSRPHSSRCSGLTWRQLVNTLDSISVSPLCQLHLASR